MGRHTLNNDWKYLFDKLDRLHRHWKAKTNSVSAGEKRWLAAVLFAIEIARDRIGEEFDKHGKLELLIRKWERVAKRPKAGRAAESLEGIDYGIGLVIEVVREYLERPPHFQPPAAAPRGRKGPASAESRFGQKRKRPSGT